MRRHEWPPQHVTACVGTFPPANPPIGCPTSERYVGRTCSSTENRITPDESNFRVVFWLQQKSLSKSRFAEARQRKRAADTAAPVRSFVVSGVRCLPLMTSGAVQEISGCKPERPRHRPPQDPTRHRITSSRLLLMREGSHGSHDLKRGGVRSLLAARIGRLLAGDDRANPERHHLLQTVLPLAFVDCEIFRIRRRSLGPLHRIDR